MIDNNPNSRRHRSLYDELYGNDSEIPQENLSNWDQFKQALPYYGATVPFLAAGVGGLMSGLQNKDKKRR